MWVLYSSVLQLVGGEKLGAGGPAFYCLPKAIALVLTFVGRDPKSLMRNARLVYSDSQLMKDERETVSYAEMTVKFAERIFAATERGNHFVNAIQAM